MALDLNALALKETTEYQLRHPVTDELLFADEAKTQPVIAHLYGTASKQHRNKINALMNRSLKRDQRKATAEVQREEGIELLVACSSSIENLTYQGQAIDNPSVFKALYEDGKFSWVRAQIDSAIGSVEGFLSASPSA